MANMDSPDVECQPNLGQGPANEIAVTREPLILLASLVRVLLMFRHPPNDGRVNQHFRKQVPETT